MLISGSTPIAGAYDYGEVARSILIAIAASYVALDLAGRVTAARERIRLAWLAGGATAMGIGIWEMHFKGMLAFRLPVPVAYHWPTLLLSLLAAILASAFALYVVSRQKMGWVEALTGSVVMGGAIAGMHYIGMAAMRLPAITRYSSLLVACSILLAILFSLIALLLAFDLREETKWTVWRRSGSAVVMGAAISAMHYTGMAAASFFPSSAADLSHAVNITPLGNFGVVVVTLLVFLGAVITSSVDRRKLQDQLRLVINTIPAMVWSALPDGSVDFVNQRWLDYFGRPLEKILGFAWMDALHPEDRAETLKKWNAAFASGDPVRFEARLRRGDGEYRWFVTRGVPLRDERGNIVKWYGTKTDIEDRKRAEADLRESEMRLREFFKNSPNLIFMKDPQGRYLYVNQEVERVLRVTEEQIKGKRDDEIFPQEQAAAYQANDRQVLQAGTPVEFEEIFVREDVPHTTIVHKFPLFNAEGAIYAIGGVATDITERKRANVALRTSERELSKVAKELEIERARLIEAQAVAKVGSWEIEFPSLEITWTEQTHCIFETDPSRFHPKRSDFVEFIHPEDRAKVDAAFQSSLETRAPSKIEYRIVMADGRVKVLEEHWKVIQDEQGRPVRLIGTCQDVTERKRSEEALQKSEERWRSVFENSAIGVALTDLNGRFLATNHVYQTLLGYTEQELRALSFLDLTHEDYREANRALVAELLEGKQRQFQIEKTYRRKDGSLIWVSNNVSLVPGSERVPRFIMALAEDITERKRTEAALRESQAELARVTRIATMGELTASIAHEINQPLGAVVTNGNAALRWLAGQPANLDEVREALERTIREANRASDVIGRIRALLQKTPPQTERLDINAVIREVLTLAHSELLRGDVTVQVELAPDVPRVLGDRVQLRQVVLNLILNAVDAMSTVNDRPRKLVIRSARDPEGALIQVQDSGTGLDPEQVDRIFEPFFTTKPEGIGMGLAIGRSIVEAHGGRLWATSASSHGAVFQFTLPRAVHERAA